jgi:hypothetical protein
MRELARLPRSQLTLLRKLSDLPRRRESGAAKQAAEALWLMNSIEI